MTITILTWPRVVATTSLALALCAQTNFAAASQRSSDIERGLNAAFEARRAGKFRASFNTLNQLVSRYPDAPRVHHELGVLYALHGQVDAATKHLSNAVRLDPLLIEARRALAEVLRAAGRFPDAVTQYRKLVDRREHRPIALRGIALCLEASGDLSGAREALNTLILEQGATALGTWAKGYLAHTQEARSVTPDLADREGLRQFRAGNYSAAAAWFEVSCGKGPTADRCYRLATARAGAQEPLGAAIALRAALRLNPKHLPSLSAWPRVVRALRARGQGGIDIDATHRNGALMRRRVVEALLNDDLLIAEQLSSAALKARPDGRVMRWLRAETRIRAGHLTWAERDLKRVVVASKGKPPQRVVLAQAEIAIKRSQLSAARQMVGLPEPLTALPNKSFPEEIDPNEDLNAFIRWRRGAVDHQLRRVLDPGLKPYKPFAAPPAMNPESVDPRRPRARPKAEEGPSAKEVRKKAPRKARKRKLRRRKRSKRKRR